VSRDRAEENDRATLAALSDPERACAVLLAYGTGGDVPWAAAKARALAPRDAVEARLLALLDLLGPAAAKGPATLPDARRGQGQRRADGAGERAVEARPARRGGAGREGDGAAAAAAGAGRAGEPVGRG
jgi:hypothetical protein